MCDEFLTTNSIIYFFHFLAWPKKVAKNPRRINRPPALAFLPKNTKTQGRFSNFSGKKSIHTRLPRDAPWPPHIRPR